MRLTKSGTRPCGLPCGGEQARTASPSVRDFVKRRISGQLTEQPPSNNRHKWQDENRTATYRLLTN